SAWKKIAKATETPDAQVDIGALAQTMIVAASASLPLLGAPAGAAAAGAIGLKVLESAAGAVKWALPVGRAARQLPDQDSEMQGLLAAVNVIIGFVQSKLRRILLVIDGLDKIFQPEQAEALFLRSSMIAQLACRVVVSGPFVLRSNPAAAAVPRFSKICVLCNEPVLLKGEENVHGSGVPFFCELYKRRITDLDATGIISDDLLKRLAYYSGGRARDFVKSIRMVAERGWIEDAPQATPAIVDRVLDEARQLLETGLDTGHIEVLEKIAADPLHRLPADNRARELLDYGQLLPYPNESEWYYPHPLLTLHLVRANRAGSNG
ncbi:MAG: hypothetical protein IT372_42805, partial [Polyangiaceae bacterium]|nr:hypothetical protein [Polyangiaceae bacterium]